MPADKARYGAFDALRDKSEDDVRTLLDELAQDAAGRRLGAARRSSTSTSRGWTKPRIEARGIEPLKADLDAIAAAETKADIIAADGPHRLHGAVRHLHHRPTPPTRRATSVGITQAGLGMPVRDYYLNTGEKFDAYRAAYKTYVTSIFELIGDKAPAESAAAVDRARDEDRRGPLAAGEAARRAGDQQPDRSRRPREDDPGHRLERRRSSRAASARCRTSSSTRSRR